MSSGKHREKLQLQPFYEFEVPTLAENVQNSKYKTLITLTEMDRAVNGLSECKSMMAIQESNIQQLHPMTRQRTYDHINLSDMIVEAAKRRIAYNVVESSTDIDTSEDKEGTTIDTVVENKTIPISSNLRWVRLWNEDSQSLWEILQQTRILEPLLNIMLEEKNDHFTSLHLGKSSISFLCALQVYLTNQFVEMDDDHAISHSYKTLFTSLFTSCAEEKELVSSTMLVEHLKINNNDSIQYFRHSWTACGGRPLSDSSIVLSNPTLSALPTAYVKSSSSTSSISISTSISSSFYNETAGHWIHGPNRKGDCKDEKTIQDIVVSCTCPVYFVSCGGTATSSSEGDIFPDLFAEYLCGIQCLHTGGIMMMNTLDFHLPCTRQLLLDMSSLFGRLFLYKAQSSSCQTSTVCVLGVDFKGIPTPDRIIELTRLLGKSSSEMNHWSSIFLLRTSSAKLPLLAGSATATSTTTTTTSEINFVKFIKPVSYDEIDLYIIHHLQTHYDCLSSYRNKHMNMFLNHVITYTDYQNNVLHDGCHYDSKHEIQRYWESNRIK
jgi:hypothetical protein